jgi:hypothetical protein
MCGGENLLRTWNIFIGKRRNLGILIKHCSLVDAAKTVFAQFPNARSIHRGFYKRKTIDDNKKVYSASGH